MSSPTKKCTYIQVVGAFNIHSTNDNRKIVETTRLTRIATGQMDAAQPI
jgi:hypothetical protein